MVEKSRMPDLPDDVVLSVRHVSKKFCRNLRRSMWYGMQDLGRNLLGLRPAGGRKAMAHSKPADGTPAGGAEAGAEREACPNLPPLRKDEFWALRDVSVELKRGEVLGLIGRNGAGKTTLLRLLSGIFPPDAGEIRIRGRVATLIALGAGFHPHLTGRENVFLNGAILGMSREEVAEKLEQIIAFADLKGFIDAPVSTYSSGMYVRLGFSVAIHLDPQVLFVDEVLAVGDVGFRRKSMERLQQLTAGGVSVIFVSHHMPAVEFMSTRCCWLDGGRVRMAGKPQDVIEAYLDVVDTEEETSQRQRAPETRALYPIRLMAVRTSDLGGLRKEVFAFKEPIVVQFEYECTEDVTRPYFTFSLFRPALGEHKAFDFAAFNMFNDAVAWDFKRGRGFVECVIRDPRLAPGPYEIRCGIMRQPTMAVGQGWYEMPLIRGGFQVQATAEEIGQPQILTSFRRLMLPVILDHTWRTNDGRLAER